MASTRVRTTCSWNASQSITTRLAETNTCRVPFLLIWNLARWTAFAAVLLVVSFVPTTSYLDRVVRVTTGRKDVSSSSHHIAGAYSWLIFPDYTEGAELVDSVLDVVRREAEGTDCLQGMSRFLRQEHPYAVYYLISTYNRLPDHALSWWWNWCRHGYSLDFKDQRRIPRPHDVHILCRPQS